MKTESVSIGMALGSTCLTLSRIRRAHESASHLVGARHLLQDGDEEAHLKWRATLQKRVECCCAFGLAQNFEPLLDGGEFLFKVGVK